MEEVAESNRNEVEVAKAQAWWTAMLGRVKQIPSFDQWMNPTPAGRALDEEEAATRQAEHDDFAARIRAIGQEEMTDGD